MEKYYFDLTEKEYVAVKGFIKSIRQYDEKHTHEFVSTNKVTTDFDISHGTSYYEIFECNICGVKKLLEISYDRAVKLGYLQ